MSTRKANSNSPNVTPLKGHGLLSIDAGIKDLTRITKLAWAALERVNLPPYLFRHGGMPCRLESDDDGAPIIRILNKNRLRCEVALAARWFVRRGGSTGAKEDAKPPMDVVENMLATPEPPLPILSRITEVPVFASDGTLQTS